MFGGCTGLLAPIPFCACCPTAAEGAPRASLLLSETCGKLRLTLGHPQGSNACRVLPWILKSEEKHISLLLPASQLQIASLICTHLGGEGVLRVCSGPFSWGDKGCLLCNPGCAWPPRQDGCAERGDFKHKLCCLMGTCLAC